MLWILCAIKMRMPEAKEMKHQEVSNANNHFDNIARRMLFGAGVTLLITLFLFTRHVPSRTWAAPGNTTFSLIHSTSTDFVGGQFNFTGLRSVAPTDGEVQLLPVGFTSDWTPQTSLSFARAELPAVSYKNTLYAIAGLKPFSEGATYATEIFTATTSVTGTITAGWTVADNLPAGEGRSGATAVIATTATGGILYVIGGGADYSLGGTNTILYKTLDSNGSLASSAWITDTQLPVRLVYAASVVRNGYLYVIGGKNPDIGGSVDTIYRFQILNSSGALGAPTTTTMPHALDSLGAVVWEGQNQGFLYVLGGRNASNATSSVDYTPFNLDGSLPAASSWITTSSLGNAYSAHGAIQTRGNIHIVGGDEGIGATVAVSKVQSALIDSSPVEGRLHNWGGTAGEWIVSFTLPEPRFYHGTTVNLGGEVYVIGGKNNVGDLQTTVYRGSTQGNGFRHAPNGNYTNLFDTGDITYTLTGITWTVSMTPTDHTVTMQYRTSNDQVNWTGWVSPTNSVNGTNKLNLNLQKRYLQYQLLFTTSVSSTTPMLRDVQLDYSPPPPPATPTPTRTVTPFPSVTPGARLPDFVIPDMRAEPDKGNSSPVSYPLFISVTNWGNLGFNRAPVLSKTAKVGQQSSKRGVPRTIPSGIRATKDYTGTTNAWFWVDVYVDPTVPPASSTDLGNCLAQGGGLNYAWIYALGLGETVNVPVQCYLPQGSHTYYAQVDTCDNPPNNCSPGYGYVLEMSEVNNIGGPVHSGELWHNPLPPPTPSSLLNPLYLPNILKAMPPPGNTTK
ncbi:hypothetical protein ANRL1_02908 [Anaerolineae bacterium]|nr:hypothetical protein ANRL1_02908 [Anaerolineae bacterium]